MMNYETLLEKVIDHQGYDLDAKYAHFNQVCFDGMLPKIPLKFAVMKGMAGVCRAKYFSVGSTKGMTRAQKRQLPSRVVDGSLNIALDRTYLRSEEQLDALLVHEMIHAWFIVQGNIHENHGADFLAKLRDCERKTGLTIPVTERIENREVAPEVGNKKLVVLIMEQRAQTFYAIINANVFAKIADIVQKDWRCGPEWSKRGGETGRLMAIAVESPLWTAKSLKVPVQRPTSFYGTWVGASCRGKVQFYHMRDPALLTDLSENGKPIFNLKNTGDLG